MTYVGQIINYKHVLNLDVYTYYIYDEESIIQIRVQTELVK